MPTMLEPEVAEVRSTLSPTPKVAKTAKLSMSVINYWLDAALFVNAIFVMWVSLMLHLVFPPATEAAGCHLWGLSYDEWRNVQLGSLCLFALLAVEHLVLHWNWVCSVTATHILRSKTRPDAGVQAVLGVGTFITISLLVLASLIAAQVCAVRP